MSQVTATLKKAKALIQDPKNWTQKSYARDKYGNDVNSSLPDACSFCSVGALGKASEDQNDYAPARALLGECARAMGSHNPITLNDTKSHEDVMKMFACAIAKSEASDSEEASAQT